MRFMTDPSCMATLSYLIDSAKIRNHLDELDFHVTFRS